MFRRYFLDDMAFFAMLAAEMGLCRARRTIAVIVSLAAAAPPW